VIFRAWSGKALMTWTCFTRPFVSMITRTGIGLNFRSLSSGSLRKIVLASA
jgi:hypothetical protein